LAEISLELQQEKTANRGVDVGHHMHTEECCVESDLYTLSVVGDSKIVHNLTICWLASYYFSTKESTL